MEGSSSLRRAIAVLLTLGSEEATHRGSLSVTEVSRLIGREKSQVSRTLKELAQAGFVDRDPDTNGYRLGWRIFTLAACAGEQRLITAAPEVLRRLVAVVQERAHLTVREADGVLTLLSESPPTGMQTVSWVGKITPLHCTSTGRALLWDMSDERIRELLTGVEFGGTGPKAPHDLDDLLARLRRDRERGYALVHEEFEAGVDAAAAPVRDARGKVVAAVNISGPRFRLGRRLEAAGRQVHAAADQLSQVLGWQPGRTGGGVAGRSFDSSTFTRPPA